MNMFWIMLILSSFTFAKTIYMGNGETYTNLQSAMAAMNGGDRLIIRNGKYTGPLNVIDRANKPPNGNSNNYTIVTAENPGYVFFDGEDARNMFYLNGVSYVQFEGIKWGNARFDDGKALVNIGYGSHHIKMYRCGGFNGRNGHGGDIFAVGTCSDVLLEECYAYGNGRYYFYAAKDGKKIIFRRCVGRADSHLLYDGHSCFTVYDATQVELQNCIAIDADNDQSCYSNATGNPNQPRGYFIRNTGQGYDMNDVYIQGCIALNIEKGTLMIASSNPVGLVHFDNCVFWKGLEGVRPRCDNVSFNNCVVGNVSGSTSSSNGFYMETGDEPVMNSIIYGIQNNYGIRSNNTYSLCNYNCLYNNSSNFNANCVPGTHSLCTEKSNEINPLTGSPGNGIPSLKYLCRIENNSDLDGAAFDGGDIGATILNRIGVSGSLYGEPGYNIVTNESLWPFPYEDRIRYDMRSYSENGINGARGFCADNQTLTNYIWGYLGNKPPDLYPPQLNYDNLSPAPDAMAVDINSDILINLLDNDAGIDVSSILLKINDQIVYNGAQPATYPHVTVSGTINNYFIKYTPPLPFPANSKITVSVDAHDLASPPNVMPTVFLSFTTVAESAIIENPPVTITKNQLTHNYPNPFNSGTMLEYHLKQQGKINLCIYNIAGQIIKNLVDGEYNKGVYQIRWDGSDDFGNQTASGIYICKLLAESYVTSQKLVKLE